MSAGPRAQKRASKILAGLPASLASPPLIYGSLSPAAGHPFHFWTGWPNFPRTSSPTPKNHEFFNLRPRKTFGSRRTSWLQALQAAYRESGVAGPSQSTSTVANEGALRQRRRGNGDAKRRFEGAVDDAVKRTGRPAAEVYSACFLNCANVTHAQLFNEAFPPADTFAPVAPGRSSEASGVAGHNDLGVAVSEIRRLHLQPDARPEELAAAQAIGSTDPQKLFDGLVVWCMKNYKYGFDAANGWVSGRFSETHSPGRTREQSGCQFQHAAGCEVVSRAMPDWLPRKRNN